MAYPLGRPNERRYERTCARCAAEFTAAKPQARFCSENCRKRAGDERSRAECEECGATLGQRTGWENVTKATPKLCVPCFQRHRAEGRQQRCEQIAEWWNAGLSMAAICERLNWAKGSVGSELNWMRANGYDLAPRRSDVGRARSSGAYV